MLSRGRQTAFRCLKFLTGIRDERPGRERIARALQVTSRTVDRALNLLESDGAIARQSAGKSTAAKINVLMSLEAYLSHQNKLSHQNAQLSHQTASTVAPNECSYISEEIQESKEAPPSIEKPKPQTPEQRLRAEARRRLPADASRVEIIAMMERIEGEFSSANSEQEARVMAQPGIPVSRSQTCSELAEETSVGVDVDTQPLAGLGEKARTLPSVELMRLEPDVHGSGQAGLAPARWNLPPKKPPASEFWTQIRDLANTKTMGRSP